MLNLKNDYGDDAGNIDDVDGDGEADDDNSETKATFELFSKSIDHSMGVAHRFSYFIAFGASIPSTKRHNELNRNFLDQLGFFVRH